MKFQNAIEAASICDSYAASCGKPPAEARDDLRAWIDEQDDPEARKVVERAFEAADKTARQAEAQAAIDEERERQRHARKRREAPPPKARPSRFRGWSEKALARLERVAELNAGEPGFLGTMQAHVRQQEEKMKRTKTPMTRKREAKILARLCVIESIVRADKW